MRPILALLVLSSLSACKSTATNPSAPAPCQASPVQAKDLEALGLQPAMDKVVVVRILRTSCPSCRTDLEKIAARFQTGEWNKDKVQLILIGYNKPGFESRASFDAFVRERLIALGIPIEATQMVWINKSYNSLLETKNGAGAYLFSDWKAVPYAMVFAKNGRAVYRGQFTATPELQEEHYKVITSLQEEKCGGTSG
jgi:hypothetical protein